ncbi:hypothetical protein U8C44_13540 (plasmid) [Sinorhizobium meliloti]|nr:hypothetical protein [Sinorhizobium meliloti]WQO40037.1 hypothetical protein U8C34_13535 [Sinorhizobium meliloti]WQO80461.1 hypothetical protein U8C44_13540 [Sinorhizobium meliloti]
MSIFDCAAPMRDGYEQSRKRIGLVDETAPDLLETAAQCAASDLLGFAAQLAGLAEDLKALGGKPIVPRQW